MRFGTTYCDIKWNPEKGILYFWKNHKGSYSMWVYNRDKEIEIEIEMRDNYNVSWKIYRYGYKI